MLVDIGYFSSFIDQFCFYFVIFVGFSQITLPGYGINTILQVNLLIYGDISVKDKM